MSILEGPVAQRLERAAHNRLVVGSIPTGPTISKYSAHGNKCVRQDPIGVTRQ